MCLLAHSVTPTRISKCKPLFMNNNLYPLFFVGSIKHQLTLTLKHPTMKLWTHFAALSSSSSTAASILNLCWAPVSFYSLLNRQSRQYAGLDFKLGGHKLSLGVVGLHNSAPISWCKRFFFLAQQKLGAYAASVIQGWSLYFWQSKQTKLVLS